MVEQPETPVNRIDWLPQGDRARLVGPASDSAPAFLQSFADQVQQTPTATAVVFQSTQLTYAELDRRSNALAGYLQQQGVGCGERIASACRDRLRWSWLFWQC